MPFIAVHIARGRPLEKRRRLIAAITEAVTEILELVEFPPVAVSLLHQTSRKRAGTRDELTQASSSPTASGQG